MKFMKKLVKLQCYVVTNGYWYLLSMLPIPIGNLVAFHFDEFFFKEFSKPPKTNGNLILAALLVESNTMVIYCMIRVQNCELTFERNKICFYGKTQILLSQKKFTLSTFIMQYATLCHIINISKLASDWMGIFDQL